jgi:hypothetical protein
MAIDSFAPTAAVELQATNVSSSVALPTTGSPTVAIVTNLGQRAAFVALGDDTVEALQYGSMAVLPGSPVTLTIGANTNLAAITLSGVAGLNIAVGT